MSLFDLSKDVAVVIGATGVLGGAIAEGLAKAGAKVAVVGRNKERGDERVRSIIQAGGKAEFCAGDASNRCSLEDTFDFVSNRLGAPTVLVNAAGGNDPKVTVTAEKKFEEIAIDDWRANFDLNLVGGVLLPCQVFGPRMVAAGRGSIINIASVSAHLPLSRVVTYSAAKAAVLSLTQFLSREWAPKGVRVNSITPGFFPAEQNRALLFNKDGSPTARTQSILGHTPMQRFGEARELIGAAIFLASHEASSFVTGTDIRVDGGFLFANDMISNTQVAEIVASACPSKDYRDKKVLLIIPDATRTAPVGLLFKTIFEQIGGVTKNLDILVALGTHQPMSEEAICERLEISPDEHHGQYSKVRFFNHAWDNPEALRKIGTIPAAEIRELSGGLFEMDVPVEINKLVFDYDQIMIVGPVFPHEVVGFSGGNKYLFPGVAGPEILNFFHWLGAVVTNPMIIGNKWTPVRKVVDRAGALVKIPKLCFCMVVDHGELAGLFAGTPETAWDQASELSRQLHITYKDRPFQTILSCAPKMYDELWTGGKCMYKLEPVLADGGELIIYAPHIADVCVAHGKTLHEVGYHCRDYFVKQWDKFKHYPWGVLAHSTHVYGLGTYENGVEKPRARVTLATGIPEAECRQINLGYRDWRTIKTEDYANREDEGVLHVPKAGEMLYHLRKQPKWAGGN